MDEKNIPVNSFGKVAVLLGGDSAEREISLQTGMAVFQSLQRLGVEVFTFDPAQRPLYELVQSETDHAFIALHGRGGEDGTIQGALEFLGIPYTGSGVLGSALAMDKVRSKAIWKANNLPTPDCIEIRQRSDLDTVAERLGFPVFVKPVNEGSSVGASKVSKQEELDDAWQKAFELDSRVMVEKYIRGREYTAGILDEQVLPLILLETPRDFYDYEAKYIEETTKYICPCGLGTDLESQYMEIVMDAFKVLGASGWGRVDLMVDDNDQPWLIELNTIPGMTSHSLVPMAARQSGMSFDDLVYKILLTCQNQRADGRVVAA